VFSLVVGRSDLHEPLNVMLCNVMLLCLGDKSFSQLDYADDVVMLAEMLEVPILSLEIMQEEAVLSVWKSIGQDKNPHRCRIFSSSACSVGWQFRRHR